MEPQKTSLISFRQVAFLLLTLVLGIVAGAAASYTSSYQLGFNAAKDIVAKSNFGAMYTTADDVRTIVGTVTAIGDNQLTISYKSLDPFADPSLDERIVRIDSSTKILKPVAKDEKLFQAEVAAFTLAMQQSSTTQSRPEQPLEIPVAYTLTAIAFADISVGDALTVVSAENIKDAKEFLAKDIQIQPRTAASQQQPR